MCEVLRVRPSDSQGIGSGTSSGESSAWSRLIDQRRRDQSLTLAVPLTDVVEQSEFNILSSPYLPVDRKEQIKPIFVHRLSCCRSRAAPIWKR